MTALLLRPARRATPAGTLLRSDLSVLAWTAEQYAARSDQLERLLGCRERTVRRTLARLRDAHMADTRRAIGDEPTWMLPTAVGLRACGSPFPVWRPRLGLLPHVASVNEVRLYVQSHSPGSLWVCERALARDRRLGEHLPDALALVDGQRVAIEVERTVKSRKRLARILDELTGRFDSVVYFCAPASQHVLRELAASGDWPTLAVRALPDPNRMS